MKSRRGFVSNSSTTSFLCEVCGTHEGFSDCIGHNEMGFVCCPNGHGLCKGHIIKDAPETTVDEMREALRIEAEASSWHDYDPTWDDDTVWDKYDDWFYESDINEQQCPICQFDTISQYNAQKYLLKNDRFLTDLKERFGTYEAFKEWLKNED